MGFKEYYNEAHEDRNTGLDIPAGKIYGFVDRRSRSGKVDGFVLKTTKVNQNEDNNTKLIAMINTDPSSVKALRSSMEKTLKVDRKNIVAKIILDGLNSLTGTEPKIAKIDIKVDLQKLFHMQILKGLN